MRPSRSSTDYSSSRQVVRHYADGFLFLFLFPGIIYLFIRPCSYGRRKGFLVLHDENPCH